MSALTLIAAAAAATLAVGYALGALAPRTIATEIAIDAPVERVWKEFAETGTYGDWNPFMHRLEGDWIVGNTLAVTVQADGQKPMEFAPTVLVAEKDRELRWVGKLGIRGIFDGEHYFLFEAAPDGGTILRHGERFTGVLAHVLFALIGAGTTAGFEAMNEALKARVETL